MGAHTLSGHKAMNAAQEAYDRLIASQREVPEHELKQSEEDSKRERLRVRIKRKLAKVY